jgi:protocatechuate 3,4-dioxygenase beta subunit
MKTFQHSVLIVALALAAPARAADGGPPDYYTATVVDDQGRPVAGATVDCYYYQARQSFGYSGVEVELTQRTVTDSNGAFAVLSAPGATLAVVKKAGLATAWKTWFSLLENSSEPVVLSAPAALAGTVLDEDNHPVAGAEVWVADAIIGNEYGLAEQANILFGRPARECFSARTGADGRFRIANFPADGHAGLAVKTAGKALRPPDSQFVPAREHRSGEADIQLRVGPAGAVEGKVTVAETGQPLEGVRIKLEPAKPSLYNSEYRETIASGEDGSFRIPDVLPGIYNVRAVIPGQPVPDWVVLPENAQVTVTAGGTARDVAIHATKGALVEVTVVSTNDFMPLAGVPVSSDGPTVYTGINGMALFRVPAGEAFFSARKDWRSQMRTADIQDGRNTNVWIELIPPPTITGIVRDPAGAPVAGALVSFHPGQYPDAPDYSEVTTDKNGRYEIILKLSRETSFWSGPISETNGVVARDLERNLVAIQEFEKIPATLDLNLQPGITLSGSVQDTNGAPVANATVDLRFSLGGTMPSWTPHPAKVNARGLFSFPAMPQGRVYYILEVTAKGYGSSGGRAQAADTKTNHYEFPAFVLKRADRKLAGQVLGQDGKPVAGATVNLSGAGQPQFFLYRQDGTTDSQGHFAFDALCEGLVTVSARANNVQGNAPAQGGDTNVVIRLGVTLVSYGQNSSPPLKITGTVRDPSGVPAAGVMMSLFPVQGRVIDSQTDSAGRYEFNWQEFGAGGQTNWLLARDLKGGFAAIHQVDRSTTNLDLTLQEGLTISTKVQDSSGQPMTNATAIVTVWAETNRGCGLNPQPMIRNDDGVFLLNALPQGIKYSFRVESPGYSFANQQAEAEDTKTNLLEMPPSILGRTNLTVAGQVLGVGGNPAPYAQVELIGRWLYRIPSTNTDESGHFVFEGLGPGPLIVMVGRIISNPAAPGISGSANVQAGDTNVIVQLQLTTNTSAPSVAVTTSGTVFDPSGTPAPGVNLLVEPTFGAAKPTQSDANGNYTIHWETMGPRGQAWNAKSLLLGSDREHNWFASADLSPAKTDSDLHLKPAVILSGAVRDTAGKSVTNATVQMFLFPGESQYVWTRPPTTNTDAQGLFAVGALPPGWRYELRVAAAGYGTNNLSLPAGATRTNRLELPPIVLKAANRQLAGQVIGPDGKPCWGARVSLSGEGQPADAIGSTDSKGNFIIKAVCEGPVKVQALLAAGQAPMIVGEVRASGGDTNIVVKLGATNGIPH